MNILFLLESIPWLKSHIRGQHVWRHSAVSRVQTLIFMYKVSCVGPARLCNTKIRLNLMILRGLKLWPIDSGYGTGRIRTVFFLIYSNTSMNVYSWINEDFKGWAQVTFCTRGQTLSYQSQPSRLLIQPCYFKRIRLHRMILARTESSFHVSVPVLTIYGTCTWRVLNNALYLIISIKLSRFECILVFTNRITCALF